MADILNYLNYDTEVGMMAASYISPSHKMALGLNPAMAAAAGFSAISSVPASTSVTQAASVASVAGCDYPSFTQFDPHTEAPPNTSGFDLPVFDSANSSNVWSVLPTVSGTAPPNYQQD